MLIDLLGEDGHAGLVQLGQCAEHAGGDFAPVGHHDLLELARCDGGRTAGLVPNGVPSETVEMGRVRTASEQGHCWQKIR